MKEVYVVLSKLKFGNRDTTIDSAYSKKVEAKEYAKEQNAKSTLFIYRVQKAHVV
jgi:hypothetical protein